MYHLNKRVVTFLPPESIEPDALKQILNISELPIIFHHVAVMPDCHVGKGATVGTVIATRDAVIPAAVGVDIGCGMIAVKTSLTRPQLGDLKAIRAGIERRIPMSAGRWNRTILDTARPSVEHLAEQAGGENLDRKFSTKDWKLQLGTLGGGNHFIEICLDEHEHVWLTVHSGSRGIGHRIASHFIERAQKLMRKRSIELQDRDLAYLTADVEDFDEYIRWLNWAQQFALLNREEMMRRVIAEVQMQAFGHTGPDMELERINCHHNCTQIERHFGQDVWVTRKGAIQARAGMKGMIPGSMGSRSYIVSGLECDMAFHSAPHGAGRRFSRTAARKKFTMADFDSALEGIEHRRSPVLLDEIPMAYKDIDQVMEYSRELVKVEHTLRQIVNIKGD